MEDGLSQAEVEAARPCCARHRGSRGPRGPFAGPGPGPGSGSPPARFDQTRGRSGEPPPGLQANTVLLPSSPPAPVQARLLATLSQATLSPPSPVGPSKGPASSCVVTGSSQGPEHAPQARETNHPPGARRAGPDQGSDERHRLHRDTQTSAGGGCPSPTEKPGLRPETPHPHPTAAPTASAGSVRPGGLGPQASLPRPQLVTGSHAGPPHALTSPTGPQRPGAPMHAAHAGGGVGASG